ncbi:hypothetical protein R3P38DRAFT_2835191 [Favolaschia claudopus]|uniref:Nephrocystin 3-like N-terminal domain-containing protein n=1 Tax=Favolaschia claudopus TaxID=2862362 RepID=A0AAW0EF64_9AGAR
MHPIDHSHNPPAWAKPNQQSLPPLASNSRAISGNSSMPVNLFNITGGTGGNGGQSRYGVAGQGGRGEGPIFNNNNYYDSSPEQEKAAVLRELLKAVVPVASYDSAERYTYPLCHPNTRTGYLSSLHSWSRKNRDTSATLWMYGPAGTGKSSIARSFCQELTAKSRLGASFFFRRSDPLCGSAKGLFPTLAYQLAIHSAEFATAVAIVIRKDPSVVSKTLATQFQRLIVNPWNNTAPPRATSTVVVIDGLDECQSEYAQQEILRCILKTSVSIKFLIVSRQEPQIEVVLSGAGIDHLNITGSRTNVRKYLIAEFKRIRRTHKTMHQIHAPWPDRGVINHLVDQSSGHFIYASTVIHFVDDMDAWPVKQLEYIMTKLSSYEDLGSSFAALDNLYIQILRAVPRSYSLVLLKILSMIAFGVCNLRIHMQHFAQFLKMGNVEVSLVLRRLNSILYIEDPVPDQDKVLVILEDGLVRHKSFYDFLESPTRAAEFAVTSDVQYQLTLEVLDWCSVLHRPQLTCFDELSSFLDLNFVLGRNDSRPDSCISKTKLSTQIVHYLHHLNLDVLFASVRDVRVTCHDILSWLKREGAPESLVKKWNNYSMLADFDNHCQEQRARMYQNHGRNMFKLQVEGFGSKLLTVVQTYKVLGEDAKLVHVKELLNYSWRELQACISPLRSRSDDGSIERVELTKFFAEAWHPHCIRSLYSHETLHTLAKRSLVFSIAYNYKGSVFHLPCNWIFVLRACSSSPVLLELLTQYMKCLSFHNAHIQENIRSKNSTYIKNYYPIQAWLQAYPNPPQDLLKHFRHSGTGERDESEWKSWCESTGLGFHCREMRDVYSNEGFPIGHQLV